MQSAFIPGFTIYKLGKSFFKKQLNDFHSVKPLTSIFFVWFVNKVNLMVVNINHIHFVYNFIYTNLI